MIKTLVSGVNIISKSSYLCRAMKRVGLCLTELWIVRWPLEPSDPNSPETYNRMNLNRRYGVWFYLGIISSFAITYIFYLPTGNAINIVSPFAFNVYVIPIKLPVQIGSSLSSLVALGALVVAKLALVGTAFLKGHHDNEEEEYSIPYHPPHGGWPSRASGPWGPPGRRRRSTNTLETNDIPEAAQQRILDALYKKDTRGCLLKFLCELGTIADRSRLKLEEQLILTLFRQSSLVDKAGAASSFAKALRIGEKNKNFKICSKHFPLCRYDSGQMMSFYYKLRPKASL